MKYSLKTVLALLMSVVVLASMANAQSITINNYNFETGDLTGWGSAGQAATINWDAWPSSSGTWVAFLSSVGGNGVLAQNGLATIQAGFDYHLTFDAAAASWQPSANLTVQLSGNGTTSLASQTFSLVGGGGGGNAANWSSYSLDITGSSIAANPSWVGQSLGVGFWTTIGDPLEFDNVRLDFTPSAVPEPTSAALLALGAIGFLVARKRRI